ncbi:hypothetical protein ALNOE001_20110 [Candidatus Methanobinarius endosymbioticus]|uniref:Uncharacterized protein n=1 Tax=Candidatus Methanobinarius endosymbioticus TaxID=2006182 RepID=A0A366M7R6_9EURY|nr:hypothetical protein ALNOE001_20110 [Candidatus Methanobinarius endosymbioticus]
MVGAISLNGPTSASNTVYASIMNSTFIENTATTISGAISAFGYVRVNIQNFNFISNSANVYGGALVFGLDSYMNILTLILNLIKLPMVQQYIVLIFLWELYLNQIL